jgi:formate dehydrogenase major subunit
MYTGTLSAGGTNKSKLRVTTPGPIKGYPSWSWCWPVNRRIIYNRASVRPRGGGAWDTGHPVLSYASTLLPDGFAGPLGTWTCNDVIDGGFIVSTAGGVKSPIEIGPYIMNNEGHCRIFGGFSMTDGPLPEHYEPLENPIGVPDIQGRGANPMGHNQQVNPIAKIWRLAEVGTLELFPTVATTYRMSEHWQAGAQTRNLPWLVELCPDVICEMSNELAATQGINNGDRVKVISKRGAVTCYALVTDRFKPFNIGGNTIHQVGVIWHFGYKGLATGHSGNLLTPHVGCANTMIPEYKAFRCRVKKVV